MAPAIAGAVFAWASSLALCGYPAASGGGERHGCSRPCVRCRYRDKRNFRTSRSVRSGCELKKW
jgi:hypothetical protein